MMYSDVLRIDNVTTLVLAQKGRLAITAVRLFTDSAAADIFLQMFDAAQESDVTLGTTIPDWVVTIDSAASPVSSGDGLPTHGLVFSKGLVIASTTTPAGATTSASHARIAIQ